MANVKEGKTLFAMMEHPNPGIEAVLREGFYSVEQVNKAVDELKKQNGNNYC